MKKIINAPENYVNEMLMGIYAAHPDQLRMAGDDPRCLVAVKKTPGKVGIATGGGSGHLPLFLGYVGDGLLAGCSVGEVFQAPNSEQMLTVTKEIDAGAGVLYIFGNYNGDKYNFKMSAEMAEFEHNIRVESVIAADDIAAPAPADESMPQTRRGVAGIVFVYKCAGAAAKEGMNLDEVKRVAQKAAAQVRTIGVALSACIVPRVGKPGFSIEEEKMALGMGIHGEPGIRVENLKPADALVTDMMDALLADMPCAAGEEVAILINSLGSTPLDELYIMMNRVAQILAAKKVGLYRAYIGEFATSMEMAGASISLFKLDSELKRLLDAPADSPFFKQFQLGD
jgi:dihydroxyacetone kinase-like protein